MRLDLESAIARRPSVDRQRKHRKRGDQRVTSAKLDEIERELGRQNPNLPAGAIRRLTTLALLGVGATGLSGGLRTSRRTHHMAWLDDAPAAVIASTIDPDAYLALGASIELATMQRYLGELNALRACLTIGAPDELYACLEGA